MGRKHQPRKKELHRRRKRREKLAKLRKRYQEAESETERQKVWEKVQKIAPWLSLDEFLLDKERRTP